MSGMGEHWVFGYGSLMWRPGFDFLECQPARIGGYHRRLCVYSFVHRGTPERPGLVLGLDRGGSCHGLAFRIEASKWQETLDYLRGREQVTSVYVEAEKPVRLLSPEKEVTAVTYLVDRKHAQYAGLLETDSLLKFVLQGNGVSGRCIDYVRNTVSHLRDMDIRDRRLEELLLHLDRQAAM